MALTEKQKLFIEQLEAVALMDERYQQLKCVNFPNDIKRGHFSLVFKAFDAIEKKHVAVKFMDPEYMTDPYRLEAFKREPKILESLIGKRRCLQLNGGLKKYELKIPILKLDGSVQYIGLPIDYFVIEWLDDDLDVIFQTQDSVESIAKLELFNEIVLAVETLHDNEISHRDLKMDNFRLRSSEDDEVVVAIDFGTAAKVGVPHLLPSYDTPVGHRYYSSPETYAGFAGDRVVGRYTDLFALGCIFYELFNQAIFMTEQVKNPTYTTAVMALSYACMGAKDVNKRLEIWRTEVPRFARMVEPPPIDGVGSSVPPGVRDQLNNIYRGLVKFDFLSREVNLRSVRECVNGALKALRNEKALRILTARKKAFRLQRQEKIRKKAERLSTFIASKGKTSA